MWTVNVSIVPDKCFTVVSNVNVQWAIDLSVQPQCHPLLVDIAKTIQNKWDCIKTVILFKKKQTGVLSFFSKRYMVFLNHLHAFGNY